MVNGGHNLPRSIEQHNPTYELTPKTAKRGIVQNGNMTQTDNVSVNLNPAQVNLNPGQVNLNPAQVSVSPVQANVSYSSPHVVNYSRGQVAPMQRQVFPSPATPHIAQMNGPVETPIVPSSASRVTERTPNLSRLQNGPASPISPQYEPRPLIAKEERLRFITTEANFPVQYAPTTPKFAPTTPKYVPTPEPSQVSPGLSSSSEVDDDGLNWLAKQQDKLREKREREFGRPIVRDSPISSQNRGKVEQVAEPIKATPVNASPKLRVRFEGETLQAAPQVTSPSDQTNQDMSSLWLAEQRRKMHEQPINEKPMAISHVQNVETTPLHSSPNQYQDGSVSTRRGISPAPLAISSDLERSIGELGHINPSQPSNTYVQRTITTTTTNQWEPHERPLNRQLSDLTHDRVRDPVFQRQAEQTPKTPATPATPYDPVPPILTSPQLKGDG